MAEGRLAALVQRHRRRGRHTLVFDSFTRADNASSLGSAETGQVWTVVGGTWGTSGNQAYCPTPAGDGHAVVDAGVADCTVQVTVAGLSSEFGLYMRETDASNWIRFLRSGSTILLQKKVAGTASTVASVAYTPAAGDVLAVTMAGSAITGRVNGAVVLSGTVTDFTGVRRHGFGNANVTGVTTLRFDDFRVTTP